MRQAADLHDQLTAAGIPVTTVRYSDAAGFDVVYAPTATADQLTQGQSITASFDTSATAEESRAVARNRTEAGNLLLGGADSPHIGNRGADMAVWTFGVNHLMEYFTARFALAQAGNWTPTADQVTAQITAARATPAGAVDAAAPAASGVASLLMTRGRLSQADIVNLISQVITSGQADPVG